MAETSKANPVNVTGGRPKHGDDAGSVTPAPAGTSVLIAIPPGRYAFLNSLRVRLLASYAVVLLLTLAVIAAALLLLLQARPVPNALILDRLAIGLQTTLQRSLALPSDRTSRLDDKIARALTLIATRANFRVLITDSTGKVRFDSRDYDSKFVFNGAGYRLGDSAWRSRC